jgi:trk system potassium uptake protein TrkA
MKNILVIGMGRFGRRLAERLMELRNHVMIVDEKAEIINELAPHFTNAQICDCTNPDVLRALGVDTFDICFVTIGENFQSSLEISSQLKELGAKRVISKANRDIQAKFLLRNGADEVVYPERDMAEKLAVCCSDDNIFDFIELTPEYSIFEIPAFPEWCDKAIGHINIRRKYDINVLTIKKENGSVVMPTAEYVFELGDHVIIMGRKNDILRMISR